MMVALNGSKKLLFTFINKEVEKGKKIIVFFLKSETFRRVKGINMSKKLMTCFFTVKHYKAAVNAKIVQQMFIQVFEQ